MGTRQEWGLLICVALLIAARVFDLAPLAPPGHTGLDCPRPTLLSGGAGEPGLVCGSRDSASSADQLRPLFPSSCDLPAAVEPGTRLEVSDQGPGPCRVRAKPMSGQHRLLTGHGIDPNRASAADLQAIPGIGPALSGRIVDFRERQGPYGRLEDLAAVRGIGPKTLERMAPYLIWPGSGR